MPQDALKAGRRVEDSGQDRLADSLRERQRAIADAWCTAIAGTSFVPYSPAQLRRGLFDLTGQAIALLFAEPFDGRAEQIGATLASFHYTQPEALGRTQGLFAREFLRDLPPDQVTAMLPRVSGFLEGLAIGFGREATSILLREQESIRKALLTELRGTERQLKEARDHLEEQVAKRTSELQVSEERWRTLIDNSPDPVLTLDREGRVLFVNYVRPESGLTLQDVLGQRALDRTLPDQLEPARAVLNHVFETGEGIVHEVAVSRPDGAVVWYAVHVGPVRRDGEVVQALAVARDITERKKIEEALQESKERWRSLVTYAPDSVLTVDVDGRILFVNHMPPESGFTADEMVGRRISEIVVPEHREVVESALEYVFGRGKSTTYESAVRRSSGDLMWYAAHVGPIRQGDRVVAAMLISRDVTERKRMENALQESEERWRTLVTNAPDVIFTLDSGGRIVYVNHFPLDSPFDPKAVIGRFLHELTVPELAEAVKATIREVFDSGTVRRMEVKVPRASGGEQWYSALIGPVWQGGAIASAIVIARDSTERKRLEEMKDNLLRDVSHELRAPLTRARVSLEMMLESVERSPIDGKGAAKYGNMALDSILRLSTAVGRILDLSRLEAGVGAFARETIHLPELIRAVARDLEPLVSDKGLSMVIEMEEGLPPVRGDREQLWRVVRNLIDNAYKFSSGGKIVVAAGRRGGEIVVSVGDGGCGILPRNLERVFDRFFREETGTDGVGVGLPMCRTIIQAHNGRIWAESAGRGLGATFRFALPVLEKAEAEKSGQEEDRKSE
jgi:PAS domain S-box-containing protein